MGLSSYGSSGGLLLALTCTMTSLATPGWIYATISISNPLVDVSRSYSFGLFYSEPRLITFGRSYAYGDGLYVSSDSMSVCMCCLCVGISYISVGVLATSLRGNLIQNKRLGKMGAIMGLIAGSVMAIGMGTFTGLTLSCPFYKNVILDGPSLSTYSWGYSFGLGWAGVALSLISGIVGLLDKPSPIVHPT